VFLRVGYPALSIYNKSQKSSDLSDVANAQKKYKKTVRDDEKKESLIRETTRYEILIVLDPY